MVRAVIGGVAGGLVIFVFGFLFWGTPLSEIAMTSVGDRESAAVQSALAQNLTGVGTGTYVIPDPASAQGTTLFGRGPIATVHFNVGGFPAMDTAALVTGLIFAIVTGVLLGLAMQGIRVTDFSGRMRIAGLFILAVTVWDLLAQPVFNHYGWTYWIYLWLTNLIALLAAAAVIARWFMPRGQTIDV